MEEKIVKTIQRIIKHRHTTLDHITIKECFLGSSPYFESSMNPGHLYLNLSGVEFEHLIAVLKFKIVC